VTTRRTRRRLLAIGALACSTVLSACGLSFQALPKPGGVGGASYALRAQFANVLNLPIQARVLIGADVVGDVSAISTSNYQANLVLSIRRSIRLPVGTTAQILFNTPLGDDFIQLTEPQATSTTRYLANNDLLSEADTSSAPSIADTLAAVGTLLNGGGLSQLKTVIDQLNLALSGHQNDVRAVLSDLDEVASSLSGNLGSIDNALTGVNQLSSDLAKGDSAISASLDTLGPAVGVLNNENSDFLALLTSLNQFAPVASSFLEASGQQTVATIQQLDAVINQLVSVEGQLGPMLSDLETFEVRTPKIAPGSYLQLSLIGTAVLQNTPLVGLPPIPGLTTLRPSARGESGAAAVSSLLQAGLP
jgi:phospholipid/cholesterol/gamma-HCH transport system substrate-binding protein